MKKFKLFFLMLVGFFTMAITTACEYTTKYTITVLESDNGKIFIDKAEARKGERVTITIEPDEGYELKNISYNSVKIEDNTFIMPGLNVTITAEFDVAKLYDVSVDASLDNILDVNLNTAYAGDLITIEKLDTNKAITNIKVNGELLDGDSFIMPREDVVITADYIHLGEYKCQSIGGESCQGIQEVFFIEVVNESILNVGFNHYFDGEMYYSYVENINYSLNGKIINLEVDLGVEFSAKVVENDNIELYIAQDDVYAYFTPVEDTEILEGVYESSDAVYDNELETIEFSNNIAKLTFGDSSVKEYSYEIHGDMMMLFNEDKTKIYFLFYEKRDVGYNIYIEYQSIDGLISKSTLNYSDIYFLKAND